MLLISSVVSSSMDYKIEKAGKLATDKTTVSVIFQTIEEANANGMSFSREGINRAIVAAQQDVKDRKLLGELDHPDLDPMDENSLSRLADIRYKEASHVITKLAIDGNHVVGEFETLATPNGQILAALLNDGIKTGVSIRAMSDDEADYDPNNISVINNFKLVTYDAVHNPAYKDTYVTNILSYKYPYELTNNNEIIKLTKSELKELISDVALKIAQSISGQMKGQF